MNRNTLILIVVALLGGWLWLRNHDKNLVERAAYEASRDSLNRASLKLDSLTRSDSVSRAAAVRLSDSLSQHRRRDSVEARRLLVRTDTLRLTVRETLSDSLKPHFDSLIAAYDSTIVLKDAQIASLTSEVQLWRTQASRSDSLAQAWKSQALEAMGQRDKYRELASPSLIQRAVSALPWMAGAYVLAKVTH